MKKYFGYLLIPIVLVFTSCLKEDAPLGPEGTNHVVEIFNTVPSLIVSGVESEVPLYVETFPISAGETFTVTFNYAGAGTAPQDINLTIGYDEAAIDYYNDEFDQHYMMLPADKFTVDKMTVTIPKGQKQASITYTLKTDLFDFAEAYVLPISIESTSFGTISKNYGTTLFSVGAKNQYDGVYQYKTSAVTSLRPNSNVEVELWTIGLHHVSLKPGLLGYYGNVVEYVIDPSTNAVSVICPSLGVQTPQDTRSKWDPATKTFTIFWKQGNGARTFEETLEYLGPR